MAKFQILMKLLTNVAAVSGEKLQIPSTKLQKIQIPNSERAKSGEMRIEDGSFSEAWMLELGTCDSKNSRDIV
jgi:hypothetical protein